MIETRDLTKMYGELYALKRLTLKLDSLGASSRSSHCLPTCAGKPAVRDEQGEDTCSPRLSCTSYSPGARSPLKRFRVEAL